MIGALAALPLFAAAVDLKQAVVVTQPATRMAATVLVEEIEMPEEARRPDPMFWWWDQGKSRARLTWQATMWPHSMIYEGLDPKAVYIVRTSGFGQCPLKMNGERVEPAVDGKQMGEFRNFRSRRST